ncbi:phosphoribosylglycinamide formyltransferase [Gracilibacillus boraciitolerans JCM 21714]|uniref:Phosphoribosylglycinamide formyltransferase n=1 Tax=Gracilibacillus boraciitolerans JCM 21714 TaxID=1298598 RepID=W4VHU3_9BACI|nr:phosphoribosylglycinamide formyltransferase [Gracilibacillus boraciitolerans]GAE92329.1 phosphoribosylglycinamide formyltransferase [Gracilibacillus boraciitolerans JCM 21714]
MTKIAIFASGTGSNYDAIVEATKNGRLDAVVALLVCDKPNAKVVEKANENGTPTFVFDPKQYRNKQMFEAKLVEVLQEETIDWIVLAGYMRLIGDTLLQPFEGKIINIHPSLLPSFPGLDAIGQAFEAGVKVSGVTIHYVDEGMDTGKIIAQQAVNLNENMTRAELQKAIQQVEHKLYPATLQKLITRGGE